MPVYGESEYCVMTNKSADGGRSIGTYNWDREVELDYPEAFQKALLKVLVVNRTFRYVYLGGAFTEPNQERQLWFYAEGRHVRVRPYLFSRNDLHTSRFYILTPLRGLPRQNS